MNPKLYEYAQKGQWGNPEFSIEKAYVCCIISKLIYEYKWKCPKDRVNFYDLTQNGRNFGEDVQTFRKLLEQNEIQLLFIFETPYGLTVGVSFKRAIIVASRGTKYWKDWCINLNILKTKTIFRDVKFHRGFNKIADISIFKVWHKLAEMVEPIYFTGHSLGAAVSAILFLKFKYSIRRYINNHKIMSAYTFGMPRFFNCNLFPIEDIHHFYNDMDIVPKIPFKMFGYENLPCEYSFDENGQLISTVKRRKFQLIKSLKIAFMKRLLTEHDIDLYAEQIEKNIMNGNPA